MSILTSLTVEFIHGQYDLVWWISGYNQSAMYLCIFMSEIKATVYMYLCNPKHSYKGGWHVADKNAHGLCN